MLSKIEFVHAKLNILCQLSVHKNIVSGKERRKLIDKFLKIVDESLILQ